jgi:hypothetical protein
MPARTLVASGEYNDPISFLIQSVNAIWQPVDLHERTLLEFRELFVKPSEILYKRAIFFDWQGVRDSCIDKERLRWKSVTD